VRKLNADLDQTIDDVGWVKENPVYCPIPWCAAHKLRTARCGDADGDYWGLHVARIEYVKTAAANDKRLVRFFEKLGSRDPAFDAAIHRTIQDSIDMGLTQGRRGRRRL
jgi:hypothetical protein